jgi:hypothetical protein
MKQRSGELMSQQRKQLGPMIVAVEMGYGHLRPAYTLADSFGVEVIRMDVPPMTDRIETVVWNAARKLYNGLSRAHEWTAIGPAAKLVLESITEIAPLHNHSTPQPANLITRLADGLSGAIIGRRLRAMASESGRTVIATYPAAAMTVNNAKGARVFCLATDTDLNRAWASSNPENASIDYFAPVERVAKRLRSFGVPDRRIHLTGFPLPSKLAGQAQAALARRLFRLDPKLVFNRNAPREASALTQYLEQPLSARPISMTIAIGGAGAQTRQVGKILQALRGRILDGDLKLTLVAGIRPDVAGILHRMVQSAHLSANIHAGIEILVSENFEDYFHRFNECLADTDVLWTKPSELVFYASLGLPILLAAPVGDQEHANRNWLLSNDAALDAGDPDSMDLKLEDLLATGELCRIAWNAYSRLDRNGTARIQEFVSGCSA